MQRRCHLKQLTQRPRMRTTPAQACLGVVSQAAPPNCHQAREQSGAHELLVMFTADALQCSGDLWNKVSL